MSLPRPMEWRKTAFMLSWMLSLAYHYSPEQLQMYTVDARYGSRGLSQIGQDSRMCRVSATWKKSLPR
ncbi:hypothetical protein VQ056_31230 [Paenibacillus sp. JTLBN-2024]